MTETRLLDFSMARPSPDRIKAAGASGVLRYLTRSTSAKRLTAPEAQTYRAADLWVGVVFEDTADRALAGRQAGHDDAVLAAQQAQAVGVPVTCPIFFAVDFATDYTRVQAYFAGIRDAKIGYPIGAYGSYSVIEGAYADRVTYLWQTVAWSGGKVSGHAHLFQRNTQTVPVPGTDENVLLKPLPLWGATVHASSHVDPVPLPAPEPQIGDDPMFIARIPGKHVISDGVRARVISSTEAEKAYLRAGVQVLTLPVAEVLAMLEAGK